MHIPGGAENIIKNHIMNSALQGLDNCLFLLDGDKKQNYNPGASIIKKEYICDRKILVSKIPESDYSNLSKIIKKMTGNKVDIKVSGNNGTINEDELIEAQKKFIDFWESNVKFLPFDTPEIFLKELDKDPQVLQVLKNDKNGKDYFEIKTKYSLGLDEITSSDIFEEQKRVVSKIDVASWQYKCIVDMLKKLF